MKSALEKRFHVSREEVESLVKAELGESVMNIICSFSELGCIADVKVDGEIAWRRYLLIENGDDEDCELRRIS